MRSRETRLCVFLFALILVIATASKTQAQTDQRCFSETGLCIAGRIREFWEHNGGLAVFGFPIGPQQTEDIEGRALQIQWFERRRLEIHPENPRPYDVLLGRLGVDRLTQQGRDWSNFSKSTAQPGCQYVPATNHNICGAFLLAWHANGLEFDGRTGKSDAESLALFGLPLSDAQTETIEGRNYTVQWFERARMELHPEQTTPNTVLFGLLGREVHTPTAPPAPTPTPSPIPGALPPSFNNCKADPNAALAPNYPIKIVTVNKVLEFVRLQNLSNAPVNLIGWRMCSINGAQTHTGIRDVMPVGAIGDFPYAGQDSIWINSIRDDGALYDPDGRLISYWFDPNDQVDPLPPSTP